MAAVDMSLDNMIQNNRRHGVGGGGRVRRLRGVRGSGGTSIGAGRFAGHPYRGHLGMRGARGPGGTFGGAGLSAGHPHRGPLRMHAIAKSMHRSRNLPLRSGMLEDRFKDVGSSRVESGTKLRVSNLNDGVSNDDIRRLFSEIGELVRYGIHYDKNGRPCGSAEVVFARRNDAFQAVMRYNNAQLDGNSIQVENVASIARAHVTSRLTIVGGANGRRTALHTPGTGYMSNRPGAGYMRNRPGAGHMRNAAFLNHGVGPSGIGARGGWNANAPVRGRGGRGRGRFHRGSGGRPVEKSAEELDKELENYQAENTQT